MGFGASNLALSLEAGGEREEVHFSTRGFASDQSPLTMLVVNVSRFGLMARCEGDFDVGDPIQIQLPVAGLVMAEVRWSLGGRVGVQFDPPIEPAFYLEALPAMQRG